MWRPLITDVIDKIYKPYDNLSLSVILHGDGTREYKVMGALAEAVKAQSPDPEQWNRLKEIFKAKSLQLVSFTITEKAMPCRAQTAAGSRLWKQISTTVRQSHRMQWRF